jgi:hypothetical protein
MENNIVKNSFDKLIKLYDRQNETEMINIDDNFCDDDCYKKFMNVVEKLKMSNFDYSNLIFQDNNVIATLISNYYTQGYTDGVNYNKENS